MQLWNTTERYGLVSKLLHWGIAALFFVQFVIGDLMDDDDPSQLGLHTSLGILLALLVLIRVPVSKLQTQPAYPPHMGPWECRLADLMKMALNLGVLLVAAFGYLAITTKGEAPLFFGIPMPVLIGDNHLLHEFFKEGHELLAWLLLMLVGVHVAAALKHHFIDGDDVLRRMR